MGKEKRTTLDSQTDQRGELRGESPLRKGAEDAGWLRLEAGKGWRFASFPLSVVNRL